MTIFVLFFVELMAMRYAIFDPHGDHGVNLSRSHSHNSHNDAVTSLDRRKSNLGAVDKTGDSLIGQPGPASPHVHTPGEDHLSHSRGHADSKAAPGHEGHAHSGVMEDFTAQMTAIFILEFGVIFHSIFVGLTLAVSGDEFHTLYVVLVFHQTFEGLGLGSRLAITPWPKDRWWIPYVLGTAYALSTPIAIAIGLGLRQTYAPGTQTALIVNGVFDSISAGILIYTGLVELMAHEFMFSEYMRRAKMSVVLGAYGSMCLGAGKFYFPSKLHSFNLCCTQHCHESLYHNLGNLLTFSSPNGSPREVGVIVFHFTTLNQT